MVIDFEERPIGQSYSTVAAKVRCDNPATPASEVIEERDKSAQLTTMALADLERHLFGRSYADVVARIRGHDGRLARALNLLETEYWRWDLSVPDLARAACLSGSVFRALLLRLSGYSPRRFIVRYRLMRAANLLYTANTTITRIASDSGFGDIGRLEKCFKEVVGMSPREFRKTRTGLKIR